MASHKTGAVFLVITDENQTTVKSLVRAAMEDVPDGRNLFVLWFVGLAWKKSVPVESIVTSTALRSPSKRTDEEWLFYGNGVVRLYDEKSGDLSETLMWVSVRRVGPKAYSRVYDQSVTQTVLSKSTIPVSHRVFTRDVANNVWHLPSRSGLERTISRLQALTSWSDEVGLIRTGENVQLKSGKTLNLDLDLVPVAEKIEYECPAVTLVGQKAVEQSTQPKLPIEF